MLPTCPSTLGDYPNSWGSATQKFSSSFHDKSQPKKKKKKCSQAATHMSKNSMQKNHVQKISHKQNPYDQKLFTTKNHAPKKVNAPPQKKKKKKKNTHTNTHTHTHTHTMPPSKISPQSKFFTYPYTTTKSFFHNHAQKFLHDQDSQRIISYMSMHKK